MKQCINNNCISWAYEQNAKDLEDEPDGTCGSESCSIFYHQEETIPCWFTEVFASKSNLNISILCQEFYESFQAIKTAACNTQ